MIIYFKKYQWIDKNKNSKIIKIKNITKTYK